MDHYTRRIVGFGVHAGVVDGVGLCRMFNRATCGETLPKYLSSDHDRLFEFHRWQANLRVLDIEEIKTVPYAPRSQRLRRPCYGIGHSSWERRACLVVVINQGRS
jgi:hypothetical protein